MDPTSFHGPEYDPPTINPRLLTANHGFADGDPYYTVTADDSNDEDGPTIGQHLSTMGGNYVLEDLCNAPFPLLISPNYSPLLDNDDVDIVVDQVPPHQHLTPKRPRLRLETAGVTPNSDAGRSPNTPLIRVSSADDTVHDLANLLPQPGAFQGRPRRNSSPARRTGRGGARGRSPSQSRVRSSTHLSPTSTSPLTTDRFVREHAYHAGDRMIHVSHAATSPRDLSPAVSTPQTPSPTSPSSQWTGSDAGSFHCDHPGCNEICRDPLSLRKHQRNHMPKEKRPHGCSKCEERFLFPKDLRRHEKTHQEDSERYDGDKPTCEICGATMTRGDNVARHMRDQHSIPPCTPSSSGRGRGRRAVSVASPYAESVASFALPSQPSTPAHFSPAITLFGRAVLTPRPFDSFGTDDSYDEPSSPLLPPPMNRSKSDFH